MNRKLTNYEQNQTLFYLVPETTNYEQIVNKKNFFNFFQKPIDKFGFICYNKYNERGKHLKERN